MAGILQEPPKRGVNEMSQLEQRKNVLSLEAAKERPDHLDLDRSGHAIVVLLQEAAHAARTDQERANTVLQDLSGQIQAAEDHIAHLQAELNQSRERAGAAEKWLLRIYQEIQDSFLRQDAGIQERAVQR